MSSFLWSTERGKTNEWLPRVGAGVRASLQKDVREMLRVVRSGDASSDRAVTTAWAARVEVGELLEKNGRRTNKHFAYTPSVSWSPLLFHLRRLLSDLVPCPLSSAFLTKQMEKVSSAGTATQPSTPPPSCTDTWRVWLLWCQLIVSWRFSPLCAARRSWKGGTNLATLLPNS